MLFYVIYKKMAKKTKDDSTFFWFEKLGEL